jgi:hypothetical protein
MVKEKSLMKLSSMGGLDIKSGNDYVALIEDDDSIYYHRGPCVFLEVDSGGCVVSVYDVIDEDCLFSRFSRSYVRYVSGDKNDMDCYRQVEGIYEQRMFLPRNTAYGQITGWVYRDNYENGVLYRENEKVYIESGSELFKVSGGTIVDVDREVDEGLVKVGLYDSYFRAVSNADKIMSVKFNKSVIRLNDRALYECSNLTGVTLGENITSIGCDAFWGCSGLTSIYIPSSVSEIGNERLGHSCFLGCSSLTSITFGGSISSLPSGAPWGNPNFTVIHCKDGDITTQGEI